MTVLAIGILALLFSADMLLKQHVEENLDSGEEKELVREKIVLRKVYNEGFMLHTLDRHPRLIKSVTGAMGAALLVYDVLLSAKKGHRVEKLGAAIFSAGACSNIFDRLVRGKVIDYIGFRSKNDFLSRLTVNLADIFIVAGLVLSCLGSLLPGAGPHSRGV
ncbi:signal peptidase II [Dorea sp. D27]|uniref:signal peptidase II n=1 Tax=Dorea sp. D27 TaxID=658665 RepID=UPI000673A636|nr:signal peptidase II [Dorea sp. D27]KMZ55899.1 putative lipoprotein signal peptidase [Dorea sp. D27]